MTPSFCTNCGMYPCTCGSEERPDVLITPDVGRAPRAEYVGKPEDYIMPFGKHKGKALGQILVDEASYLDWLNDSDLHGDLADAVKQMCAKYDPEIQRSIADRQDRFRRQNDAFYR